MNPNIVKMAAGIGVLASLSDAPRPAPKNIYESLKPVPVAVGYNQLEEIALRNPNITFQTEGQLNFKEAAPQRDGSYKLTYALYNPEVNAQAWRIEIHGVPAAVIALGDLNFYGKHVRVTGKFDGFTISAANIEPLVALSAK